MIDKKNIGRVLEPFTTDVEKGRLRFFSTAIGETDPVYSDESVAKAAGYNSLPVPPTFTFCLELDKPNPFKFLDDMGIKIGNILHGEQSFTYHIPICAGDRITFEGKISDIYEKKGGALEFVVQDYTGKNQNGDLVVEMRRVIVVRNN